LSIITIAIISMLLLSRGDKLTVDNLGDSVSSEISGDVRVGRLLVDIVNTGEALDLAVSGSLVQSSSVDLLTVLQWCRDVDEVVVSARSSDRLLDGLSGLFVWRSRGGDDGRTGLGELGGDEGDSEEVLVLVFVGHAEVRGELVADVLAQEERDRSGTVLLEGDLEGSGDGVFSRVVQTRQHDYALVLCAMAAKDSTHW